jgi:hypothetical protein
MIPIALLIVWTAHAGNNTPATFGPVTDHFIDNCEGFGQAAVTGSAGGSPANGNHGLILFGSGTMTGPNNPGCIGLNWIGSGSGIFSTNTLPGAWIFTITTPSNVSLLHWSLGFILSTPGGGFQASDRKAAIAAWRAQRRNTPRNASPGATGVYSCGIEFSGFTLCRCDGPNCGGTQVANNVPLDAPNGATFSSYFVGLTVEADWNNSTPTQLTVNVPADSSIHINVPQAPSVPAPSGLVLTILAFGALALARVFVKHRQTDSWR